MGRLDGKVAVVTGGASGIGAAIVDRFVEEGAVVVVADLQEEAGGAPVDRHGATARFLHTDVTDGAQVAAAVDLAVSSFGRLDVMVNNAGIVGAVRPDRRDERGVLRRDDRRACSRGCSWAPNTPLGS